MFLFFATAPHPSHQIAIVLKFYDFLSRIDGRGLSFGGGGGPSASIVLLNNGLPNSFFYKLSYWILFSHILKHSNSLIHNYVCMASAKVTKVGKNI
jgi:hypothetical protein